MTREQLARALYATEPGSNGYPPLAKSLPWEDAWASRDSLLARADEILRLVASLPPGERAAPQEASDKKPSDVGEAEA